MSTAVNILLGDFGVFVVNSKLLTVYLHKRKAETSLLPLDWLVVIEVNVGRWDGSKTTKTNQIIFF